MRCPYCKKRLFQLTPEGAKLRTRILVFNFNGQTTMICPECKADVAVGVVLEPGLINSLTADKKRLIVAKRIDNQKFPP
jgi:hypothetical protein